MTTFLSSASQNLSDDCPRCVICPHSGTLSSFLSHVDTLLTANHEPFRLALNDALQFLVDEEIFQSAASECIVIFGLRGTWDGPCTLPTTTIDMVPPNSMTEVIWLGANETDSQGYLGAAMTLVHQILRRHGSIFFVEGRGAEDYRVQNSEEEHFATCLTRDELASHGFSPYRFFQGESYTSMCLLATRTEDLAVVTRAHRQQCRDRVLESIIKSQEDEKQRATDGVMADIMPLSNYDRISREVMSSSTNLRHVESETPPVLPILPSFHDWREVYPELQLLLDNYDDILMEATQDLSIVKWTPWPEQHYDDGGSQDWKVFPFCYTFPADDETQRTFIDPTCAACPKTSALLRRLPNLRTALFSRLGPKARISAHRGWADLSNHVLRTHLGLRIPKEDHCAVWVEGETQYHSERDFLVFDDSKLHKAYNQTEEYRIVFIVDLARPPSMPIGQATGKMTAELGGLIDLFS